MPWRSPGLFDIGLVDTVFQYFLDRITGSEGTAHADRLDGLIGQFWGDIALIQPLFDGGFDVYEVIPLGIPFLNFGATF